MSDRLTKQEYDALVADLLVQGPGFICKATAAAHRLARKTVRRAWFSGWPSRGWPAAKRLHEEQQQARQQAARPPANPMVDEGIAIAAGEVRVVYASQVNAKAALGSANAALQALFRQLNAYREWIEKKTPQELKKLFEDDPKAIDRMHKTAALVMTAAHHASKVAQITQEMDQVRRGEAPQIDVNVHVEQEVDTATVRAEAEAVLAALERRQPAALPAPATTGNGAGP